MATHSFRLSDGTEIHMRDATPLDAALACARAGFGAAGVQSELEADILAVHLAALVFESPRLVIGDPGPQGPEPGTVYTGDLGWDDVDEIVEHIVWNIRRNGLGSGKMERGN